MIDRFYSWPIRLHLIILIALLAIPSVVLIVNSGIDQRRDAATAAKGECVDFVTFIAGRYQSMVAGSEQLVGVLALLPEIRSRNSKATNALLSELVKKNPRYANLVVADTSGFAWASAIPFEGKLSMADRKYFQDAVRTGLFSSGEYDVGKATKKPVLTFGYPVKNASDEVIAVIAIAFDLAYTQQYFEQSGFLPGASFSLLDHWGTILVRNLSDPFSQKLIGTRDIMQENWTKMIEGPNEGTYGSMGNDGRYRLVAYKKLILPHESKPYLYVRSSIPLASATAKANAAMLRNLSVFGGLFLVALFLAWFIGKRALANPVRTLKAASQQLAAGAETVNVSQVVKVGELGELARAFDDMAERLNERGASLRESEEKYRNLFENIEEMVTVYEVERDDKGQIAERWLRDANGAFLRAVGVSSINEIRGKTSSQVFGKVWSEVHLPVVQKAMDTGQVQVQEVYRPESGRHYITSVVRLDAQTYLGTGWDITERKRAEEQVEQTYGRLKTFFDIRIGGIGIVIARADGSILQANDYYLDILGHTRQEFDAGKVKWVDRTPSEWLPADERALAQLRDHGAGDPYEKEYVRCDGTRVPVLITDVMMPGPENDILAIVVNMTERKRVEAERDRLMAAVQQERDRLVALVNSITDEIWFADAEKKVTLMNLAAWNEFGSGIGDAKEVEKITASLEVYRPNGTPRPVDEAPLLRALRGETVTGQEEIIRTPATGQLRHRQVNAAPVQNADGVIIGSVCAVRDITDRKHMEDALQKAHDSLELRVQERTVELSQAYEKLQQEMSEREQIEEQLRQSQKMEAIGTLAGGIAHDFNNILAAILGFTEMAAEDVADRPEVEKNLRNVLKSATRARELVKNILSFSRKTNLPRNPLSLSPIIKETVQLLRASIPATIEINLTLSASSDTVLASPVEVQQILMNLATNASLAMQDTGGTLEVSLSDIDFSPDLPILGTDVSPGEYVQLVVKDTGIGMSPDAMKRVFEPFFTTRGVGKGTGMGLAVVYGIVKDLLGAITVESEPGKGSTFRVLLPKVKTELKEDQPRTVQVPGGKERILFVDDEELLAEWGKIALERLGYGVTAITDPAEAVRIFRADPSLFDLVVTDHAMPHMAGSELSSEFLKIRPDIPIILCTGHSETMSREKAKDLGIKEFLIKPLNKQELAEAVRRVLDEKSEV